MLSAVAAEGADFRQDSRMVFDNDVTTKSMLKGFPCRSASTTRASPCSCPTSTPEMPVSPSIRWLTLEVASRAMALGGTTTTCSAGRSRRTTTTAQGTSLAQFSPSSEVSRRSRRARVWPTYNRRLRDTGGRSDAGVTELRRGPDSGQETASGSRSMYPCPLTGLSVPSF